MKKLSLFLAFLLMFSLFVTACGEEEKPSAQVPDGIETSDGDSTPDESGDTDTPAEPDGTENKPDDSGEGESKPSEDTPSEDKPAESDTPVKPTTPAEIVDAAWALEKGAKLEGEFTLTGKIISVDTAWSEQYKNITVTIAVEGKEDKPIQAYRLKGDGAEGLAVGDTITVTGELINYADSSEKGKVEFNSGCTVSNIVKGETTPVAPDVTPTEPDVTPTEPDQPTTPVEPDDKDEEITPTEPTEPTEPDRPTEPTEPTEPDTPIMPTEPTADTKVWVANTKNTAGKYHSVSTCSNMKAPVEITVAEAEAIKKTPCSKCW